MVKENSRYGIGEWYGDIVDNIEAAESLLHANRALKNDVSLEKMLCPFVQSVSPNQACSKSGGVCTLRKYYDLGSRGVSHQNSKFVTVCPQRFWSNDTVIKHISKLILDTEYPTIIKEVPFLESTLDDSTKNVGRIDVVAVNEQTMDWCAIEMQAVYFSGEKMDSHFRQYITSANGLPYPDKVRRPDWRSSGPKRLLPQLQTKVPTLSRWGRKTAVVIDNSFRSSLGAMKKANDLSNCDVAWIIVDYRQNGEIEVIDQIFTTLLDSISALTAAAPISKEDFEISISNMLNSKSKKVVRI